MQCKRVEAAEEMAMALTIGGRSGFESVDLEDERLQLTGEGFFRREVIMAPRLLGAAVDDIVDIGDG